MTSERLSHQEVLDVANRVREKFETLVRGFVRALDRMNEQ
jgi:purine nucleoside phosphorylase